MKQFNIDILNKLIIVEFNISSEISLRNDLIDIIDLESHDWKKVKTFDYYKEDIIKGEYFNMSLQNRILVLVKTSIDLEDYEEIELLPKDFTDNSYVIDILMKELNPSKYREQKILEILK